MGTAGSNQRGEVVVAAVFIVGDCADDVFHVGSASTVGVDNEDEIVNSRRGGVVD